MVCWIYLGSLGSRWVGYKLTYRLKKSFDIVYGKTESQESEDAEESKEAGN